jgi:hypothetical protein
MYLQYKPLEDKPIAQYPVRKKKCRFCEEKFLPGEWAYHISNHLFHCSCANKYKELQDKGMLE